MVWIIPADLLTAADTERRRRVLPLDLDAEIARFGRDRSAASASRPPPEPRRTLDLAHHTTKGPPHMNIEFWVDPACPFCWATARWVVDEVEPNRDSTSSGARSACCSRTSRRGLAYYDGPYFTHRLLRVMESVRTTDGNDGVFKLYWELGRRIHHDGDATSTAADALRRVGLDTSHAAAFDDERGTRSSAPAWTRGSR